MNRLSILLAVAVVLVLPTAAMAGPDTCEWHGMNTWVFQTGQTPYTYNCNNINNSNIQAAQAWAATQCQLAWDNFASSQADVIYFDTDVNAVSVSWDPSTLRWHYSCSSCIDGFLPYLPDKFPVAVDAGTAGGNAVGVLAGTVHKIELVRTPAEDGVFYLVDILTDSAVSQVRVSAATGEARLIEDERPAICSAR